MVDFDGDGKKDLISGSFMGHIFLYTNVGTAAEPAFDNASGVMLNAGGVLLDIGIGNYLRPTVADWDGDGILDVLYGEVAGTVTLLRGEGPS